MANAPPQTNTQDCRPLRVDGSGFIARKSRTDAGDTEGTHRSLPAAFLDSVVANTDEGREMIVLATKPMG